MNFFYGLKIVFFLIGILLVAVFLHQNTQGVPLTVFEWEIPEIKMVYVLIGTVFLGFLLGLFFAALQITYLKDKIKKLEEYIEIFEKAHLKNTAKIEK